MACTPSDSNSQTHQASSRGDAAEPPTAFRLPEALREVSGLALRPDGRLYAVADEVGHIFALHPETGTSDLVAQVGNPVVWDDFEGIATHGNVLWLTNSDGRLYTLRLDEASEPLIEDTGFGARCEIEGLSYHLQARYLYFACKTPRQARYEAHLSLFAWSPGEGPMPQADVVVALAEVNDDKKLHPSGVTVLADGSFLIIAAKERRWVHISDRGQPIGRGKLDKQDHPQAEGIALRDDAIFIADEGKRRGRLQRYEITEFGIAP